MFRYHEILLEMLMDETAVFVEYEVQISEIIMYMTLK